MKYEIEGEIEDPNTGEKLPFKSKFNIVNQPKTETKLTVDDIIGMLEGICNRYEQAKLYDKMEVVERILQTIKEKINPMEADEYGSKHLPELDAYPYVNILYKRIQELNTRIKLIDAEKSLTPKERMEAIADVTREQNEASKDVDRVNSFLSKARAAQ